MTDNVISCHNIWKLYGDNPDAYLAKKLQNGDEVAFTTLEKDGYIGAIRDVSLEVRRGEKLVIMGLSGSGKSTLVRCMTRLVELSAGRIMIEGVELGKLSAKELIDLRRSKMGMVFQNFALLPHRTVLENVAFPLQMRGQKPVDCRHQALEVIKLVGLQGREGYFPRELSGGQQQRVGIARSLAIEPDIWFLDEPFSALDPLIRKEMQDEFLRLQAMLNKTILFITHDFNEALRLADRIAIMKDGVIEQIDTPDQIVLHPATDYVFKFVEEIEKARVVRVGTLALSQENLADMKGKKPFSEENPLDGQKTLHELAAQIVADERAILPIKTQNNDRVHWISRQDALNILLGVADV